MASLETDVNASGKQSPCVHVCVIETLSFVFQVLFLLLLAMPEALSREAVVDVPLASSLLSLPFYLLCLFGSALHVLVCTSAGGPCYLCSLPWVLVFTVILLSSAFMCALFSMAARRMPTSNKTPTKVSKRFLYHGHHQM